MQECDNKPNLKGKRSIHMAFGTNRRATFRIGTSALIVKQNLGTKFPIFLGSKDIFHFMEFCIWKVHGIKLSGNTCSHHPDMQQ